MDSSRGDPPPSERIEDLVAEIRKLRNLDTAKGQFLATVSHELRTPLNAILAYAGALREELPGELTDDQRRAVESIGASAQQILEMVDEILRYARSAEDGSELSLEEFELEPLLEELCESHRSFISRKSLSVHRTIAPGLPPLRADRTKVGHTLANLLSNAIEFTPPGGSIELRARPARDGRWACVEVEDTGVGIPPGDRERIFEAFVRADDDAPRRLGGSGLGLSIARRFVELHGGTIGVESQPGEGSCFRLTLPTTLVRESTPDMAEVCALE